MFRTIPTKTSTVNFNDLSTCASVETNNLFGVRSFMEKLEVGLNEGTVEPNSACLKTLLTIANSTLPPAAAHLAHSNRDMARDILVAHFYLLTRPAQSNTVDQKEGKEEKKYGSATSSGIDLDELTEGAETTDDDASEMTETSDDETADSERAERNECAQLTGDGSRCGLGGADGFQFLNSGNGNGTTDCHRECVTDLCPQWMDYLMSRGPTVAILTDMETGETKTDKVFINNVGVEGTKLYQSFYKGTPRLKINPENISAACRLLNTSSSSAVVISALVVLDSTIPQSKLGKLSISFPEFAGGNYLVRGSQDWKYDPARGFTTRVTIPYV